MVVCGYIFIPMEKKYLNFRKHIYTAYLKNKRPHLPWRKTRDPYHILVSEVMLQQTQVSRVLEKYVEFLHLFPTLKDLAAAKPHQVLTAWQGLGYNRRALFLQRTAKEVVDVHGGVFPTTRDALLSLPGIGQSTAGAILNFAFNIPTPFIETNIRSVFIYHFFKKSSSVRDIDILHLVEKTLDVKKPRTWFYALYDYGTELKATLGKEKLTLHKKSSSYTKQSTFKGSNRELRGAIIRIYTRIPKKVYSVEQLQSADSTLSSVSSEKVLHILQTLVIEGFLQKGKKPGLFGIL